MRISIRHGTDYIIELNQLIVNGKLAVGGYGFTFILKGGGSACTPPVSVFDLRLTLSIPEPVKQLVTLVSSSTQLINCNEYAHHNENIVFECVLNKEQIIALESYRGSEGLKLGLELRALTISDSDTRFSNDSNDFLIPREEWLNALKNSGYRETLLFEIPVPKVSNDLTSILSKAQEFIETGHYKDAVMQCRHIVENIEIIREDRKSSREANKKAHSDERKSMSSVERLLSHREQVKNICQLAAHGNDDFTRSQARTIFGMTMVLLSEPTVGFTDSPIKV